MHSEIEPQSFTVFVTKVLQGVEISPQLFKESLEAQGDLIDPDALSKIKDAVKLYKDIIRSRGFEADQPKIESLGRKYLDDRIYISQLIKWDKLTAPAGKVQEICELGTMIIVLVGRQVLSAGLYRDLATDEDGQECLELAKRWAQDLIAANQ